MERETATLGGNGSQGVKTVVEDVANPIEEAKRLLEQDKKDRVALFTTLYAELVKTTNCEIRFHIQLQQDLTLKVTPVVVAL